MDDVSEDRAIVLVNFDPNGVAAMGRQGIEQVTESSTSPLGCRILWRELMPVVDDMHDTVRVDADAGKRKGDWQFGWGFSGVAIAHAR
jgi:hypothetical protein